MEASRIADLIDRVMSGDPWHGPSVAQVLDGVSAAAAARPGPNGTHGIWELVLHMTGWAREVTARLNGRAAQDPEGGDWPALGAVEDERWEEARHALFAAHRELAATLRRVSDADLMAPVTDFRNDAVGVGLSKYLTAHGIVHHTLYHSGQIALLTRARP